jgi:hypothetical protein
MTYSIIIKALVIGSLLTLACSSVAVAGQDLSDPKAMEADEDRSVITELQQRRWEMKMLSWQQTIAESIQEKRDNMLLIKENIDYQLDVREFSVDLGAVRKRIVQN